MVPLINGLDFVFLFVAVWGGSRFKTKEKKEKIAPQHLFTALLSNFKGRNSKNQLLFFFLFLFFVCLVFFCLFYEDDEVIH